RLFRLDPVLALNLPRLIRSARPVLMPPLDVNAENIPSLIDRLIDRDPKTRNIRETPAQSLRQLKVGLRRDLEWLLNARRTPEEIPGDAPNLERSVFAYGLPDISHYSLNSQRDQVQLT